MSIKKAYNFWAKIYDSNENKTRDLDKKVSIDILSKYAFTHVLELGCGTGKNTKWLIDHSEVVTGFDFSAEMLEIAKNKISNRKAQFFESDINKNWDIPNQSVNLVTASLTLEHIDNLAHIFKQAFLKLKKGGIFFICELHPIKQYLGSKARYETSEGIHELEVYIHHLSDYIIAAKKNAFEMLEVNEHFDESDEIPRLISFIFRK